MLAAIIKKEIRELIGSSTFTYTLAVCAALILLAFYSGARHHQVNVERWEASQQENIRRFEGVTDWLRVNSNNVYLPPQPLAALVSGVSNDIGRTAEVQPRGELATEDSRYNEEPIFAVFRFLDLEFIFQVVLSLFAILLAYDAVSGERERGTLKLIMANAVSRPIYLLGKFIGAYLLLSTALLMAIAVGTLFLPVMGIHLNGDEWGRLALIVVAGLLYFGAFLALSVFVSSLTRRSSTSFLVLLVCWIGAVMILPRAAVLTAGRAVDVPSVDEVAYKKAGYSSDLWKDFRSGMKDFRAPQSDNTGDPSLVMDAFNKFMDSLTSIRDEKMDLFAAQLNEDRANRVAQREQVAFSLARLSPSASLTLATSELAGTSVSLKDEFYEQAMNYQPVLANFLKEKTGMNVGGRMVIFKVTDGSEEEEPEPIDPTEIPAFTFQPPPLTASVVQAVPDMGVLLLYNLLFVAGAFIAFGRYDVR